MPDAVAREANRRSDADPNASALPERVVFFDGDCGLCTRSVRFLLARDRGRRLFYAPLAGATARGALGTETVARALASGASETLIYLIDANLPTARRFEFSDAWLAIGRDLGGGWRIVAALARLAPRFLRDAVYRFVAKRRKRWFPDPVACAIPATAESRRLLP